MNPHLPQEGRIVGETHGLPDALGERITLQQSVLGLEELFVPRELGGGLHILQTHHVGGLALDLDGGAGGVGSRRQQGHGEAGGQADGHDDGDHPLMLVYDPPVFEQAQALAALGGIGELGVLPHRDGAVLRTRHRALGELCRRPHIRSADVVAIADHARSPLTRSLQH